MQKTAILMLVVMLGIVGGLHVNTGPIQSLTQEVCVDLNPVGTMPPADVYTCPEEEGSSPA